MLRPGMIQPFARHAVDTDEVSVVGLSKRVGWRPAFPGPAAVLRVALPAREVVSSTSKMSAFSTWVPERAFGRAFPHTGLETPGDNKRGALQSAPSFHPRIAGRVDEQGCEIGPVYLGNTQATTDSTLGRLAMPNPRKRRTSDDDIAELYRKSLLNPGRFTVRFWDWIDYVTSRRFALRLTFVVICSVGVLSIGWAIRWLMNAGSPSPTPATPESQSS